MGRKATIDRNDLFQATLRLIRPGKSISALSLREISREADISPNSFYRHFKDTEALAVALIEQAGESLRAIIREARLQASQSNSVIRSSVEVFVQQLNSDEGHLSLLLRESHIGSPAYKQAVDAQLNFFTQELRDDLLQLEKRDKDRTLQHPDILAKAITQLVFQMGARISHRSAEEQKQICEETIVMIR
ncbi:MAG: TetR family transcriptional regulator, partial [Acinetobacter sp.]|nr:TetR family transcriptional regulator [Acinetobacter sp.]